MNNIKSILEQVDWSHLDNLTIENAYQEFTDIINKSLNTVAPLKTVTIKPQNIIKDPWMTRGLIKSSRTSSRLYRKCINKSRTGIKYKNKAIRDGRPRPPRHQVGWDIPLHLTPIPNLYDHSFPRYGQITFLTFRRPTTLTFDLKF